MPVEWFGVIVILLMFVLMFFKVPIAIAMVVPAVLGIFYLKG